MRKDFLNEVVAEKTLMKNVHMRYKEVTEGKIENLKKEGKMRISILIFIYTIHFAYLKVYNPKSSSCRENSDKIVHVCYIGVTDGKLKKKSK